MPSFVIAQRKGIAILTLLSFALLLALPVPAGAQDMMADGVFISVRHYEGIDPADNQELERVTREGFVPIISGSDGFIAYYVVYPSDGSGVTISIFDTREQAIASNELARDFIEANLAPLLPNPPRIVEGMVDIGFVELLDGMDEGAANRLHASVRIYDGFNAAGLDEFVSIVEDGFLPIMRASAGFFGYYLMHDGAGAVSAISIFDTEASALASNEQARDFAAENLTAYLPNDPLISSGRVGIAVLADLNEGANLIEDMMMEQAVFASVRVYDGVDSMDQDEIARLTTEGFLPLMRGSDGFVGYFLLPAGDMLAAISIFDSAEQASASNDKARDFVAEKLAPLLPNAPLVFEGSLSINHVAALRDSDDQAAVDELFSSIRFYEGFDLRHYDEANDLAISHLLPAMQELGGFFAQFAFSDGEDTVVGISIFANEESALAANDVGKAFTREYLAEWAPNPPTGLAGKLAIAARAEINMGENLVGAMMDG